MGLVIEAAAGVFDRLARLRGGKPIHTPGVVYQARIQRYGGARHWGIPWLDEPGEDVGVGRLSRGVGLPAGLPDVLGLAIRFTDAEATVAETTGTEVAGAEGRRHDLLLSTTGVGRGFRHLMLPRRDPVRSAYSTLFPYRCFGGDGPPVLLLAHPRRTAPPGSPPAIRFVLAAATPSSSWDRFGILSLTRPPGLATPDAPVSFDPVRNPLPGLRLPAPLAALRSATYAAARRGRHADPAELRVSSLPLSG